MKRLILFTLLFLFYQTGNSQIVISSCYAPDSIVELYQLDADYLTVTKFYDSSHNPAFAPDSNSIYVPSFSSDSIDVTIPKHLSDSILKALVAVYNATEIPERDTVIDLFEIHTHREFGLNRFSVPDSLLQNGLPSGNNILDSLALIYELYIENNSLYSPNNLDPLALSNASWDPIEDSLQESFQWGPKIIVSWHLYSSFIPASDRGIQFKFHEEYTTLIYTHLWSSFNWSSFHRNWEFRIYPDCSVEFVGVTGSPIPQEDNTVSIGHKTEFKTKLYPNPTSGDMFVESAKGHKAIVLDVLGRVLHTQEIYPNNKNLINLNHLEQGNYILHIKDKEGNQIEAKSFVKIR